MLAHDILHSSAEKIVYSLHAARQAPVCMNLGAPMAGTEVEPLHRRFFYALAGETVCFLGEYAFRLFLLLLREAWQADQPQGTFAIPLCGFVILLALGNRQLSYDACNPGPRLLPDLPHPADLLRLLPDLPASSWSSARFSQKSAAVVPPASS